MPTAIAEHPVSAPSEIKALMSLSYYDLLRMKNELDGKLRPYQSGRREYVVLSQGRGRYQTRLEIEPDMGAARLFHRWQVYEDVSGAGVIFEEGRGIRIALDHGDRIETFTWTRAGLGRVPNDIDARSDPKIQKALAEARQANFPSLQISN